MRAVKSRALKAMYMQIMLDTDMVAERRRGGDGAPIPFVHVLFFASGREHAWRTISPPVLVIVRRATLTGLG
jgi:hypothetical protein